MGLKHMQEASIPPTRLNPALSTQVEYVILKALEKRRMDRYPDILTFIQELQANPVAQMRASTRGPANSLTLVGETKEQYLNEGIRFYSLKRYNEALAAYEQALCLDSHFADAYFGKGNALYSLGRYREA